MGWLVMRLDGGGISGGGGVLGGGRYGKKGTYGKEVLPSRMVDVHDFFATLEVMIEA